MYSRLGWYLGKAVGEANWLLGMYSLVTGIRYLI